MEMNFYAPIFTGEACDDSWQAILGRDYTTPATTFRLSAQRGGGCVATTSGFSPFR
jgi:hypothetical protein